MANSVRYLKDLVWATWVSKRDRHFFDDLEAFCLFIGHGRSGHTAYGSVLNAHPELVLAHELDALSYVKRGISRDQLCSLILKKDRWFSAKGCKWHGYDYAVPNQWQGRFRKLRVIGDRKAGVTTLRLQKNPELLPKLRRLVGVPVKTIHLLRNPYDIISTLMRQSGRPLDERIIDEHFRMSETNRRVLEQSDPSEILTIRHEDIVANPRDHVRRMLHFLGLEADDPFLVDACSIIHASPSKSRKKYSWPDHLVARVQSEIDRFPFLKGYSFES